MPIVGKPMLELLVERAVRVRGAQEVIVATTTSRKDDPVSDLCFKNRIQCYRGPEDDVLARFYEASKVSRLATVIRICGDSPLLDPQVIDDALELFLSPAGRYDYVSNVLKRTFPRGLDCEVFSFKALEKAYHEAKRPEEREHVTPYFYNHPELFRLGSLENKVSQAQYRWTVDTIDDLELVKKIFNEIYSKDPGFMFKDVILLLEQHPEWASLNAHIKQKAMGE